MTVIKTTASLITEGEARVFAVKSSFFDLHQQLLREQDSGVTDLLSGATRFPLRVSGGGFRPAPQWSQGVDWLLGWFVDASCTPAQDSGLC